MADADVAIGAMQAITALQSETFKGAALCDDKIVEETCLDLNSDSATEKGNKLTTSAARIQEELSMTDGKMLEKVLEVLKVQKGTIVNCAALCSKVVKYIGSVTTLPPASDTACYRRKGELLCDLDVSPEALSAIKIKGDLPETTDKAITENGGDHLGGKSLAELSPRFERFVDVRPEGNSELEENPTTIPYTTWEVIERIANFFRIYPEADIGQGPTFTELSTDEDDATTTSCTDDIPRIATKTRAWVSTVIRRIQLQQTRSHMQTWFGKQDVPTRTKFFV